MQLRNDKLQSEVESKNRELAATIMSIVRKNELLMSIKEALLSSGNGKEVLHIVDDIINSESDWEPAIQPPHHRRRQSGTSAWRIHAHGAGLDQRTGSPRHSERNHRSETRPAILLQILPRPVPWLRKTD